MIDEMKEINTTSSERNEIRTLERKLAHSRLKITEQGDAVRTAVHSVANLASSSLAPGAIDQETENGR